jgi:single-strand DNA-binding protein
MAVGQEIETMSEGLNKVMLIGHLGRSPEMRYTPSGKPVTSFSIVTTYPTTSSNGTHHDETDWFNVIVWGALAETCKESLYTGQRVFIEGRMKTRQWTDAENVLHSCAEVVAQRLIPLQHRKIDEPTESVGRVPIDQDSHDFESNQE